MKRLTLFWLCIWTIVQAQHLYIDGSATVNTTLGKVGINTSTPLSVLNVVHTGPGTFGGGIIIEQGVSGSGASAVYGNPFKRSWMIGTSSADSSLRFYRLSNYMTTNFTQPPGLEVRFRPDATTDLVSDSRLKENIADLPQGELGKLMALRPKSYVYKTCNNSPTVGFLAQEVAPLYPHIASYVTDEFTNERGETETRGQWMIAYMSFIPHIVSGIQEQQAQITAQQAEIEALKAQNALLMQRLERVEAKLR